MFRSDPAMLSFYQRHRLVGPSMSIPSSGQGALSRSYCFHLNCVACTSEEDLAALNHMLSSAVSITRDTFMRHCGPSASSVFRQLGYADHPRKGLTAAADYHITYYRSTWREQRCYFFRWSAIEYIFVERT